jgi:hypothetical protein
VKCWSALTLSRLRGSRSVFVFVLFGGFLIEFEEAVEGDDRAVGAQFGAAAGHRDGHLVELGGLHLAGDCTFPDELVEAALFVVEIGRHALGRAANIGGAHGFMGFLGVLGLADIFAGGGRHVIGAEMFADMAADAVDGFPRHLHAIGPHIGDEAGRLAGQFDTFIELLRSAHDRLRAHAEFAASFLLQRGGGEGGWRIAFDAAALDGGHGETAGFDGRFGAVGKIGVVQVELIELLAVQMGEFGGERGARRGEEMCLDAPVFTGLKDLDLGFALADKAQGH